MDFDSAFENESDKYLQAKRNGDAAEKWGRLERMHILGQTQLARHFSVHFLMLGEAVSERKFREMVGQIFRIFLVFPGHVFHALPSGNVGTTRVRAFAKMEVPDDLRRHTSARQE